MSYCRWSSDDFKSDVYVYGMYSKGKKIWPIHIAEMKSELIPIGLPYDGQNWSAETLEEIEQKLLLLRETGYHVPERALQRIRMEMEDAIH